ncbi:MAG TPA: glycosyltransferase [Candidatus Acidoferrales bacterium]|nr:glycosyltransferase [Candidatus Acidoferrales bacterium]
MNGYLNWLSETLDGFYLHFGLSAIPTLLQSTNLIFWIVTLMFVRYQLPELLLYVAYLLRPRWFEPPALRQYAGHEPLISFLIAGRNPGVAVLTCIRSILESNYQNVEVVFADDKSTDDTVALARSLEGDRRVRVFANQNHSGKPANLNVALMFARGEFIFVLDSDSQIFPDTLHNMLPYFEDPTVGGVSPSILVRNTRASILTRFQEFEYVMTYTLNQLWRDSGNLITIMSGMGTMFRASALRAMGGYDMGLGDDTDITIRLRKAGWRLRTSLRGRISTDVPVTLGHLIRQRSRWTRNMVKMRLRKHRDLGSFRYGMTNAFCFYEQVFNRVLHPYFIVGLVIYMHFVKAADTPVVVGGLFCFGVVILATKFLIGHDMTRGEPRFGMAWLVPFYAFYRLPLLAVQVVQVTRELLMIKPWHPYVPRRIWDSIPYH